MYVRKFPKCLLCIDNQCFSTILANPLGSFHYPRDCADVYKAGKQTSGVYTIYTYVTGLPVPYHVWCDMDTDQGGWLVGIFPDLYSVLLLCLMGWLNHNYSIIFLWQSEAISHI